MSEGGCRGDVGSLGNRDGSGRVINLQSTNPMDIESYVTPLPSNEAEANSSIKGDNLGIKYFTPSYPSRS